VSLVVLLNHTNITERSLLLLETIIMSLKQEQGVQDTFIRLLFTHYVDQSPASRDGRLQGGRQRWFLEDRIPKLGEVRGKIVMLSRFVIAKDYGFPGGISPPIWPNSLKGLFSYNLRSSHQLVQTQDWYDIGSLSALPGKMSLIEQLCDESGSDDDIFSLNYCNGSSFPFALPPAVAKGFLENGTLERREKSAILRLLSTEGVNSQLRNYVAGRLFDCPSANKAGLGAIDGFKVTWALDYYNEPKGAADLVNLLIEANF
jgi:1-phosphatidylinositol phosphodiesterase